MNNLIFEEFAYDLAHTLNMKVVSSGIMDYYEFIYEVNENE